MVTNRLSIAGVPISLHTEDELKIPEDFREFLLPEGKLSENEVAEPDSAFHVWIGEEAELQQYEPEAIYQTDLFVIGSDGSKYFIDRKTQRLYARQRMKQDRSSMTICFLPEGREYFDALSNCFFHIGLEQVLLTKQRFILHASFIDSSLGGILFSGPSGIGKSTQAELWCQYENATLINGDRPILYRDRNRWMASGSPYAGSSRCYKNEQYPVRAIVILKQARECGLRRLSVFESFQCIYSGTTMNSWNKGYMEEIFQLIERCAYEIPIYELSCTPTRDAVELLNEELQR